MRLKFTKMHGLGNDFVVIDAISQRVNLSRDQITHITDRNFGVGCDQLLIVEAPNRPHVDFNYRIFNNDGTEVEHCGNGARCFAKFVCDQNLTHRDRIRVNTMSRQLELSIGSDGLVEVDMGPPDFDPEVIGLDRELSEVYRLKALDRSFHISAISMGNPHLVTRVSNAKRYPVEKYGRALSTHKAFKNGVNVSFVEVISRDTLKLRVYERGVGETLACGTGACATAVAAIKNGWCDAKVNLELKGGKLEIEWQGDNQPVIMRGPADTVFEGYITL